MNNRWLVYLSIGVLSGITLLLFALRLQPVWTPGENNTGATPEISAPTVTFVDPSIGPAQARVTIVEFGDFQCAPCAQTTSIAKTVQASFPNDVRLVWKHAPNDSAHPYATTAAVAAQCAERQHKFWAMADGLFRRQALLNPDQFGPAAQEAGLDMAAWKACNDTQDTLAIVTRDKEEAAGLRLTATPTTFINGQRHVGALSIEEMTGYVNAILHP